MACPILTFFNNKGGVGKTTLVAHVAAMAAIQGKKVVLLDLDPQSNLTGSFLNDDTLADVWEKSKKVHARNTIFACVSPLLAMSDLHNPSLVQVNANLYLLPGAMGLAGFEDELSDTWGKTLGETNLARPFRAQTAFWQIAQMAAREVEADLIIIDVGPNLGAINRSALVASDFVAIPIGADLFSLQGLSNLGPALRNWRSLWRKRVENWPNPDFELPRGRMEPIGYLLQQYSIRLSRPVKAYDRWAAKVPDEYRRSVLNSVDTQTTAMTSFIDPFCLANLKHYRSLIPLSQENRIPIFSLTSGNGAIGAHQQSVKAAYSDFAKLTQRILDKVLNKHAEVEF
jgi:chromosome partitioning protein